MTGGKRAYDKSLASRSASRLTDERDLPCTSYMKQLGQDPFHVCTTKPGCRKCTYRQSVKHPCEKIIAMSSPATR